MCDALHRIVSYNNERVLEVNLDDVIDRSALDIVGLAGFGVDFDTLRLPGGAVGRLHKAAFDLGDQEVQVVLSAMFLPDWLFSRLPLAVYRENRAGVKALRAYCRGVIREGVSGKQNHAERNLVGMAAEMDTFSEDELVDLSMDLLVAGHKTASSALQIAFYTLAQYADVQGRLREEIRGADLGTVGDGIGEVKVTPYLEAVLNELLRLYPPLAQMTRVAVSSAEVCGMVVPSGTKVVVSQWAMNRSTAQWGPDAAEFRPERWLEEGGPRPHLLTFSKGPRNCIGEGFARRELAVLVSAVVERFELSIVLGDEEEGGRVRRLQQGITLKVRGCRVGVRELESR